MEHTFCWQERSFRWKRVMLLLFGTLFKYGDFAGTDVIDANGLDVVRGNRRRCFQIAGKYIVTKINANPIYQPLKLINL